MKTIPIEQAAKVADALDLLQQAQNDIYHAAQKLCSVDGFAAHWNRVCKHGDATKELWHCVNDRRQSMRLRDATVLEASPI